MNGRPPIDWGKTLGLLIVALCLAVFWTLVVIGLEWVT